VLDISALKFKFSSSPVESHRCLWYWRVNDTTKCQDYLY